MKVKNLSKTYKTNGGDVQALKGLTFDLPDNGMVFVLGKSGCGKSTLLNVLSGLDSFDSGDIIFEGKSLKSLSPSELDDYRNSYCGFVFQEYNLIPELNVYDNIALALELRGEKDIQAKVSEALNKVELKGYEKRKVTELSGGQKQRIAIARSIIKDPKIVFADEPSGALDSETGDSIFELLKKLSEDKLVVVVSHDRESASRYGDRIIELSDGKVIGDSDSEFVSNEKDSQRAYKRPKMPFKFAAKIGCSNFRFHPMRLIATVFLAVIAFSFLGIALNPVVDSLASIAYSTMEKNKIYESFLQKIVENEDRTDISNFTRDDIDEVKKLSVEALPVNSISSIENMASTPNIQYYIAPQLKGTMSENAMNKFGFSINGDLPNENEVAITRYTAEVLAFCGIVDNGSLVKYSASELIGKPLIIDKKTYTISGIIDTHFDSAPFEALKKSNTDNDLYARFCGEIYYGAHNILFVGDDISKPSQTLCTMVEDPFAPDRTIEKVDLFNGSDKTFAFSDEDGIYLPSIYMSAKSEYSPISWESFIEAHWENHKQEYYEEALKNNYEGNIEEYKNYVFKSFENLYGITFGEIILKAAIEYEKELSEIGPATLYITNTNNNESLPVKVKGIFVSDEPNMTILADNSIYDAITKQDRGSYNYLIVSSKLIGRSNFEQFMRGINNGNITYKPFNYIIDSVLGMQNKLESLKNVMIYLSCAFAVFSVLLLLNFMLYSVTEKTNTIGILKSLGCSNFNLVKIFILEGLILGALIFVLTLVGHSLFGWLFSLYFSSISGPIYIAVFGVTPLVSLILFGVLLVFTVIGCVLPIVRLSRLKPMEYLNKII